MYNIHQKSCRKKGVRQRERERESVCTEGQRGWTRKQYQNITRLPQAIGATSSHLKSKPGGMQYPSRNKIPSLSLALAPSVLPYSKTVKHRSPQGTRYSLSNLHSVPSLDAVPTVLCTWAGEKMVVTEFTASHKRNKGQERLGHVSYQLAESAQSLSLSDTQSWGGRGICKKVPRYRACL